MPALADLLYPELCVGCARRAKGGLCRGCAARIRRLGPSVCRCCGAPAPAGPGRCRDCTGAAVRFDVARQAAEFGGVVRTAIHRLKYRSERSLGEALALLVVEAASSLPPDGPHADGLSVTWVPAPPRRLRDRGYDHAQVLAEHAARALGWPSAGLLRRTCEAPPQRGLEPRARRRNVAGTLAAVEAVPPRVAVVDDVYTTGATASEAARALKAAGAEHVVALAVARTVRPTGL